MSILLSFANLTEWASAQNSTDWVSHFALAIGVVYIILQYRAHPLFWHISVLNALPLMYVNFVLGNYASFALFTYYLIAALMVLFGSKKEDSGASTFYIQHTPKRLYPRLALIFIGLSALFFFLIEWAKPWIPVAFQPASELHQALDATATALSFVTMWLLTKQYFENWYGWLIVNATYTTLYIAQGNYSLAVQFGFFLFMACLGIPKWRQIMRQQAAEGRKQPRG